jgi:amphi-Trp domain-containing protein
MSDFKHEESEQLSPQQVAERLTDLAYALATGGALKLGDDEQITVPVADHVLLERVSKSKGGRVEMALELSWSTVAASPPAPRGTVSED